MTGSDAAWECSFWKFTLWLHTRGLSKQSLSYSQFLWANFLLCHRNDVYHNWERWRRVKSLWTWCFSQSSLQCYLDPGKLSLNWYPGHNHQASEDHTKPPGHPVIEGQRRVIDLGPHSKDETPWQCAVTLNTKKQIPLISPTKLSMLCFIFSWSKFNITLKVWARFPCPMTTLRVISDCHTI